MKHNLVVKPILIAAGTILIVYGAGTPAVAGWSSGGSSSRSSGGSSSWSSGGSSSWSGGDSQKPVCSTSNITLNLTRSDCAKCHPSNTSTSNAERHHALITPKNLTCFVCHQADTSGGNIVFPVITDCIVCHTASVHNTVEHCVVDTCGGCHPESLPEVHAGGSAYGGRTSYHSGSYGSSYASSSGNVAVCYLCHTSTRSDVKQAIVKGLSGMTVSCSDCHGGGSGGR